ncbi:MAG: NAD(P)/FAD-dependent oxidoreductase [Clostridia bacterium]|nr:NAD(P)/FAD-dependent oxidoreductase [Clostridia bacterium]
MKYVIIGNGPAAIGAIEGIRKKDKKGAITLISKEPHHTYSRPLISYLLLGKTDEERMKYRPDGFYKDNGVDVMLGVTAESIDPVRQTVKTDKGKVPYDRLLIAAGSRPFIPPMKGFDAVEKKYSFMTLDDAKALSEALTPETRVLIIGAGLIGLKCAEGISGLCGHIAVVDLADRILSSILDREAAAVVEKSLREHGMEFYLSDSVEEFKGGRARLKSGKTIEFDVLVTAVGVKANISLVKDAGGACERGIIVNDHMETTVTNVYAAGDCAQGTDCVTGQSRILALMPNAYMQGECAGRNMAGEPGAFDRAMAQNAIGFFGLHMVTAGAYEGEVYFERGEGLYKKLFYRDDRLMGYIIIGDIRRAGIYTAMIRDRTPLSGIDFELICKDPSLLPFGKKRRAEMLGGVKN